jgi:hypothetical protein
MMLRNFTTAVRELQRTFGDAFNPYRPELYYMRGPGPACRAKTARKPPSGKATSVETIPTYRKLAKASA